MSQVTKPECRSSKVLEPTIDRFGGPIRRSGPGEECQHVGCASFQCSSQPPQLRQTSRQSCRQDIDDSLQELLAFATVLSPVSSHDVLIDGPGDFDLGEVRISKETDNPFLLPPCEQVRARVQRPPCPIQRIRSSSTMSSCLLLDAAANVIEGITGEFDDVEWVHDFHSIGKFFRGCGFEPGESVHRNDLNAITPVFRSFGQPLFEDLLRPTGHHIEKACRSRSLADRGEIDDDGDIFVPASGVSSYVFVDADHRHTVESSRIVDQ